MAVDKCIFLVGMYRGQIATSQLTLHGCVIEDDLCVWFEQIAVVVKLHPVVAEIV